MSEKKLVVAVVGATGAVGREMLKTLESRNFPATEVVPFASARSAGTKVPYGDSELVVRELKEDVFEGIDIAIFSACRWVKFRSRGKYVIRSSAFLLRVPHWDVSWESNFPKTLSATI